MIYSRDTPFWSETFDIEPKSACDCLLRNVSDEFLVKVVLKTSYVSIPLFVVQGCCLGMEVTLDSNSIPFGTVFYKSRSSRKLTMTNTGDINSR